LKIFINTEQFPLNGNGSQDVSGLSEV